MLTCQRQSIDSVIEWVLWALTSNDVTKRSERKTSFYRKKKVVSVAKQHIPLNVCLWIREGQAPIDAHDECIDEAQTLSVTIAIESFQSIQKMVVKTRRSYGWSTLEKN